MKLDLGGGYLIRSFEPTDQGAMVKYANNRKVWLGLRDMFPHPYTGDDAIAWLKRVAADDLETHYAIATSAELIGGIGMTIKTDIHRRSAELGYWLGEPFWGKGVATRAVTQFTEYAFSSFDITRLYAEVFSNNTASIRVLEKVGYVYEGCQRKHVIKDGKLLDMLIYAVIR